MMLGLAVGVEVLGRTGSGLWTSVTVSLGFLPYVLFSGLAGVLVDRYSRSLVLFWSFVLRAMCAAVLAVGITGSWPVPALVTVAAAAAVLGTPSYPALAAATPDLVPDEQLPPANALVTAVENAAWMAGPGAMGLLLLVGGGPGPAALVAAALFAGAAATAGRVRLPGPRCSAGDSVERPGLADTLLAGTRVVAEDRRARLPIIMAVLDNFLYGYLVVAMLLLGTDVLAHTAGAVGWLNASFATGAFAALAVTNRVVAHPRPHRVLPALMVLFALSASALALTDRLPVAAALVLVAGASTLVAEVLSVTLLQRAAPPELTARVFGVYDQLSVGAIALGSAVAGPLTRLWGASTAVGVVGLVVLGASVAVGSRMRSLHRDTSIPGRDELLDHHGNGERLLDHHGLGFVSGGRHRRPCRRRARGGPESGAATGRSRRGSRRRPRAWTRSWGVLQLP